ncbi:MAG: Gfo/Idh/MocA family oxidoreductase [Chloroflexi bacterium]|nr:Gfo/Idh/MocA family oxidoreductase [Chloroflexota bacterium]
MADKIRVGIVGATVTQGGSGWGANAHVPALASLPDYELRAVCTAHEDTARASAEAFGAPLAFHDMDAMVAHPEVDLVAVVVKVPTHHELVMKALKAGKPVFCEWPLGRTVAEAEEMANLARERSIRTIVGLQARSDPAFRYARDLISTGQIGDVLAVNMSMIGQASLERGAGRFWQGDRANGANPLTIQGGHGIDALCSLVGEFTEVSGRVSTQIREWRNTDTGEMQTVDAPDAISVAGRVESGAEVAVQIATVPVSPSGTRLEIFGRDGTILLTSGSSNVGPNRIFTALAGGALAEATIPAEYHLAPEGTPAGAPRNVAHAYARIADAWREDAPLEVDFELGLRRHRLLAAIEQSSDEGRVIPLT